MSTPRWLLLLLEIPATRSSLRVRVWRRLRDIGAVRLSTGAYLLPDRGDAREDLEWLREEVGADGGTALVGRLDELSGIEDGGLVELFRSARAEDYRALVKHAEALGRSRKKPPGRREREGLATLERRLSEIERIDYFPGPERERARAALKALEEERAVPRGSREASAALDPAEFRGKRWVTRPDPKIDRLASAWFIRRFVDPRAGFRFDPAPARVRGAIAYDAPGARFTHRGEACTLEVLARDFGVEDTAVREISEIVHDLDLKDGKFGRLDAPGIERLIQGLVLAHADDAERLERGIALFDELYLSFRRAGRPTSGRERASSGGGRARVRSA